MHPRYHKPKTYHVKLAGEIEPEKVQRLSEPMDIDGYMTKPAEVSLITRKKEYSVVAITLLRVATDRYAKCVKNYRFMCFPCAG